MSSTSRSAAKVGTGAYPHKAIDVIPCAAATILALQNVAARETDPLASIVVTIGTIEGGYRNNVIADRVKMTGTLRTHDPGDSRYRRGQAAPHSSTASRQPTARTRNST